MEEAVEAHGTGLPDFLEGAFDAIHLFKRE